jgi:hypothetical protein
MTTPAENFSRPPAGKHRAVLQSFSRREKISGVVIQLGLSLLDSMEFWKDRRTIDRAWLLAADF